MAYLSKRLRFDILKRDGFRCRYCGRTADIIELHVDHIIPRAASGTDEPENLCAACSDCNHGKSDRPLTGAPRQRQRIATRRKPAAHRRRTRTGPWEFEDRYGVEIQHADLELYWEVHCDPISDNWLPDEIDATDLLIMWWREYGGEHARYGLRPGYLPIWWFVDVYGPMRGTFEFAPFAENFHLEWTENFLSFFTWPRNENTGDTLKWASLPVRDKRWRDAKDGAPMDADKGGFIQEALGWKPSAYQSSADFVQLARLAGISLERPA